METLRINIEFGGGTELLTATPKQKTHALTLPAWVDDSTPADGVPVTAPVRNDGDDGAAAAAAAASQGPRRRADMRFLLQHVAHNVLVERPEMLVEGDGVRAGVLVLINDSDWELEGESAYVLQDGDSVAFISTLHGG